MGALPRDSGKICIGDGDQQIAPEKEGVSIFFGRSSIETVKSFAVNRCNSIPKEFEEDLARAPSTGSVARKAAFFDHYIRSVSLEKKVASVSVSEEEEDCQGEGEEEEEQEQGFVFLEQPRDDPVEDQLDQVEAEEEEDEEQRDLAECPTDPAAEETANDEEQEQGLFASTVAAAADVPEEQGTMNPFKDGEVDGDEAEEESTTRPAIKSEELNATIEKPEKNSAPAPAPAPAPASASAAASRRRNSRTTTRSSEQVINKWKSKQGLIPGFRAAQVTSKTATEQSAGRKAVVAASSSSKGGRTKNNSETAAAAAGAAAAAAAAVAKSPVDDEPNAIRRPSSNPRDRDRSGRSIGSGAANGFTFRSNERAEKRKEFNRRMEAKQSAKEAEKNKMQAKTQEEMQAEIKELRRGLNFKATPMPGFYQEQPSTKSAPDVRKQPVHHHARNAKPVPPSDVHRPSRQQRNDIGKLKKAAGGRTTTSSAIAVS